MLLKVTIPEDNHEAERRYIIKTIVEEFLGLECKLNSSNQNKKSIIIEAAKKKLILNDSFFNQFNSRNWLSPATLPSTPLKVWTCPNELESKLMKNTIPVLFGEPFVEINEGSVSIGIDIFGSSFFMLSRYEEAVVKEKDAINRFPARASIAYKEGFLDRPIVNEYLEIFWACIKRLWPELKRKKRSFRTLVSCDVDDPFDIAYDSIPATGKRMIADIVKRKSLPRAISTYRNLVAIKKKGKEQDPYFKNIYYQAGFLEKNNLRGAFYFICGNTAGKIDGDYDITSNKLIQILIKDLVGRGHEVGLHGSYNTYNSYDQLLLEHHSFIDVLKKLDIPLNSIGGRQHYLRWQTPETALIYEKVGLAYDTTLTYADYSGFRSGICYEYPVYDIKGRRELNLIERPLIAMEGTVIQKKYMGLGDGEGALKYLIKLKDQCKSFNGDFTLLWHNSFLNTSHEYQLFEKVVLH